MHQYKFTLDGDDVQPTNLNGFTRILDLSDGRVRRVEYSGTLQFCDDAYDTIKGTYFFPTVTAVCTDLEMTIEYRENPHDSWTNFGNAVIDRNSIEYDNENRTVQFSLKANDNIAKIVENGRTEFTIDRSEGEYLTMFEYESGTEYSGTKLFYNVATVIDQLLDKMGTGSTLSSDVFTTQYAPKVETIACQAIAEGDEYKVTLGQIFTNSVDATITGPAGGMTDVEVAEAIEKMLVYNLYTNEKTALKSLYNVCVSRSGANVTITSNVAVAVNLGVSLNSVGVSPSPVTEVQAFSWGLQDLYISAKGMKDTDLEISWDKLWNWLYKQFNLGLEATNSTTIKIDWLYDMILGTTPASIIRNNVLSFTRKLDTTYMKETIALGSKFKIQNFDKSQLSPSEGGWVWADPDNDHIYVGTASTQTYDFNQVPDELIFDDESGDFQDNGGRWSVLQYGAARNLSLQFQLDLNIQAGNVASESGNYVEVHINGGLHETLPLPSISSSIPTPVRLTTSILCLETSDVVVFKIGNPDGTWSVTVAPSYGSLNPVTSVTTIIQPSCQTAPEVNEEEWETSGLIYDFDDFSPGCSGQFDNQTEQSIYSGMGYAISQHIQGLQEYDNTHFVVLKDSIQAKAESFEVCYYHPADPDCDCRDDNFFSHFFYNIPIQHHYSAYLNGFTLPSRLNGVLYLREIEYDGTTYTLTETVGKDAFYQALIKDIEVIEFEDCLKPSELKTIESERTIGFDIDDSLLGAYVFDNRYKKVEFELATGQTRFELRGQRI